MIHVYPNLRVLGRVGLYDIADRVRGAFGEKLSEVDGNQKGYEHQQKALVVYIGSGDGVIEGKRDTSTVHRLGWRGGVGIWSGRGVRDEEL